jgi:hypothetical protein
MCLHRPWCFGVIADLWSIPSPAAVMSVELTPNSDVSTIIAPVNAPTRFSTNNITLGWAWISAFSQDLNFTVASQSGLFGTNFTIRLVPNRVSDDTSWEARISGAGLDSYTIDSDWAPWLSTVSLPYAAPVPIALDNSTLSYWMAGDNCALNPDSVGTYTTRLSPSDFAVPQARSRFAAWTGQDGNLYLFGGFTSTSFNMGDL